MNLSDLASAAFVDAIIGLIVIETILRCMQARRSGLDDWYRPIAHNLAGAALLLALRFALVDAADALIIAALGLALLAHMAELTIDRHLSRYKTLPERGERT